MRNEIHIPTTRQLIAEFVQDALAGLAVGAFIIAIMTWAPELAQWING